MGIDNVAEIVENVNQKNHSSTNIQNVDKNLILEFLLQTSLIFPNIITRFLP